MKVIEKKVDKLVLDVLNEKLNAKALMGSEIVTDPIEVILPPEVVATYPVGQQYVEGKEYIIRNDHPD